VVVAVVALSVPVFTAPVVVKVEAPMLILPKLLVIEPASRAPTPVIPVYEPAIRPVAKVPLVRLVALRAVSAVPTPEKKPAVVVPVTVRLASVPTDVKDDDRTLAFKVAPVNVLASAVTVMLAPPLKLTPLMVRAVCRTVAEPALPVIVV